MRIQQAAGRAGLSEVAKYTSTFMQRKVCKFFTVEYNTLIKTLRTTRKSSEVGSSSYPQIRMISN